LSNINAVSQKYNLFYPDLHRIWLHISADPSPNIATAMFLNRSTKLFRQLHCTTGSFVQYAGKTWLHGLGGQPPFDRASTSH
jgi:hypothetical protein